MSPEEEQPLKEKIDNYVRELLDKRIWDDIKNSFILDLETQINNLNTYSLCIDVEKTINNVIKPNVDVLNQDQSLSNEVKKMIIDKVSNHIIKIVETYIMKSSVLYKYIKLLCMKKLNKYVYIDLSEDNHKHYFTIVEM